MKSIEQFDPNKHESVEGGFVNKEAAENLKEKERLAEICRIVNHTFTTAQDLLHLDAYDEDYVNDRKQLQSKINSIDSKEELLEEVINNGFALEFIPEELKNDKSFLLEALDKGGIEMEYLLYFASKDLKNDKEFVLEVIKKSNGYAFRHASESLRDDKELALEALKTNFGILEYASPELRNDKELVLASVKTSGRSLEYASEELRNDMEVVLEAIREDSYAFKFASEEIQSQINEMKDRYL